MFHLILAHKTQSQEEVEYSFRHPLHTRVSHFRQRAPLLNTTPRGERHLAQMRDERISSSLAPLFFISSSSVFNLLQEKGFVKRGNN